MGRALVSQLLTAAEACQRDEDAFRRESQKQLEALTALRIAAYRRHHLLKGMAAAVACEKVEEAIAAAIDFSLAETGWTEADAAFDEVRERLAETATAVQVACAANNEAAEVRQANLAIAAMMRFEAWYSDRFSSAFLDLLEAERAVLPVTDF